MKNKEAFEKWKWNELYKVDKYSIETCKEAWEACEAHYESRKCEECKHYLSKYRQCIESYSPNFSCKYWEAKE